MAKRKWGGALTALSWLAWFVFPSAHLVVSAALFEPNADGATPLWLACHGGHKVLSALGLAWLGLGLGLGLGVPKEYSLYSSVGSHCILRQSVAQCASLH